MSTRFAYRFVRFDRILYPHSMHSSFWTILGLLLALAAPSCVSKSRARIDAQAAFLAGQQQALSHSNQPGAQIVTVIGQVRTPTLTWTQDLTLANAIIAAGYLGASDPVQIIIIRNGQPIPIDPKHLLGGKDVMLQAGDTVHIQP